MSTLNQSVILGAVTRIKEMVKDDPEQPMRNAIHLFTEIEEAAEQLRAGDVAKRSPCCKAGITCHCVKCGASVKPRP